MAKDLPYFKFFVSEWSDGDITQCSLDAQGLFINICAIYWSRGCDGNNLAMRNLCDRNANAYKELVSAKIIKKKAGAVSINFLDDQLNDSKNRSDKNREIALKRWKPDAKAMPTHTNGIAKPMPLREEKRREDEIKKEESTIYMGDPDNSKTMFKIKRNYMTESNYLVYGIDGYTEMVESQGLTIPKSDLVFLEKFLRDKDGVIFEGSPSFVINSFKKFIKDSHK